ncbi:hypothetical protein Tco_0513027, partial [Tanacetum coccineum]
GDDDDDDSSDDDADDEDEDEGDIDDEDEEEEEEHLALADSAVVVPTVELVSPPLREQSLLYHHPLLTLLPLELGLLSDFRLPYHFHQRQRLRDF